MTFFFLFIGYVLPFNAVKMETELRRRRLNGFSDKVDLPKLLVRFIAYHPSLHYITFVYDVRFACLKNFISLTC